MRDCGSIYQGVCVHGTVYMVIPARRHCVLGNYRNELGYQVDVIIENIKQEGDIRAFQMHDHAIKT